MQGPCRVAATTFEYTCGAWRAPRSCCLGRVQVLGFRIYGLGFRVLGTFLLASKGGPAHRAFMHAGL